MKKEIDTWKLEQLFNVFKGAMLWAWYLTGAAMAGCLWFFPIPQISIQAFVFAGVFIWYTLLSVCISKLESIRTELK